MVGDYRCGRVEIRVGERLLSLAGQPVPIGSRAFDLLLALVEARERVVLKRELLDRVWPESTVEENNLAVHISALRKVFGKAAIATVPGRGYQFTARLEPLQPEREGLAAPVLRLARPSSTAAFFLLPPLPAEPALGREKEPARVCEQLAKHRLVTLTGSAGMGKSTLALLTAHHGVRGGQRALGEVAWLELGLASEPASLPGRVAQALGHPLDETADPADALDALVAALHRAEHLLVLDNADLLLEPVAALVDRLLAGCPRVRFLVTSREPLGLLEERVLQLGPLALPPTHLEVEQALGFGAVALFDRQARAAHPDFRMSAANVAQVIELCSALEGVPLAIYLAASRLPVMAVDKIISRLAGSLVLLRGESLAESSRQRTQQAALERSHALLSATERAVFRRLAVFEGGFTTELAMVVARDHAVEAAAVGEALVSLAHCALVWRAPAAIDMAPGRCSLSASAQDFALRRLGEAGELDWARRSHLEAVIRALGGATSEFKRLSSEVWSARYGDELPNLRAAILFALRAAPERALAAYAHGRLLLWLEGKHKALRLLLESLHASLTPQTPADVASLVFADLVLLRERIARSEPRRVVSVLPAVPG